MLKGLASFILGVLTFVLIIVSTSSAQQDSDYFYTVEKGDYLIKIATEFGSPDHWKIIYEANKDKIEHPDVIYAGQKINIPSSLLLNSGQFYSEDKKTRDVSSPDTLTASAGKEEQETLQTFREVFQEVIDQEKNFEKETKDQKSESVDPNLSIDGMVLDETQSKMGRDFYKTFYNYWKAPPESQNYMITIEEQPIPSLGTMVLVKVNNEVIYRSRLQPRYDYIEEVSKQAVAVCYKRLLNRASSNNSIVRY